MQPILPELGSKLITCRKHHRIEQHAQMWCFAHDHYDLFEQRFDSGFARGQAETLEQTAHLVFDISSKVDQLGACRQQRMCISTLRAFDVCFAVPAHPG